jgi:hypothetical protein
MVSLCGRRLLRDHRFGAFVSQLLLEFVHRSREFNEQQAALVEERDRARRASPSRAAAVTSVMPKS